MAVRSSVLDFRVLGPLEVWRDGQPVKISGERQRELVTLLLLNLNEVVPAERLIEDLYGGDPSGTAANSVQALVSRLRRVLDEGVVVTKPPGYLLSADPDRVDLRLFERLAEEGRDALARGDPARATVVLREALGLWRGPPLVDLMAVDVVQPEVRRLEELRLAAWMDRIDADLAAGPGGEIVPEVEALVAANLLQERLRGQLMLALYRAGRQADALAVYRETRDLLHRELGLEPSRALQQLERAILVHDAALGPAALSRLPGPEVTVCPFKGLAAFEIADAEFFCGRERAVSEVVSRLASASFVGIVGPSGVGKSSLLRAGLLQRLSVGVLPGSARWRVAILRPGVHPAEQLLGALGGSVADLQSAILADERLVVVVDQLEEAFTLCEEGREREEFFASLADLADDPARRTLVVVCLRADFYGRCAHYPRFADLLSRSNVLVGPMERDELVRAIELPAGRAGLQAERALVDALVADVVNEPGALPLLSTMLLELWRRRDERVLRLDSYRDSGGVRGAVARLAEDAYAGLPVGEQALARTIFLRLALGDGDTVSRRRVPLGQFDAPAQTTLDRLVAARLLSVSDGAVEVAHEVVLREWPRLRQWLEDDREGRRVHSHLEAAAREWDAHGRDRIDLYRGQRLAAALEWAQTHPAEVNALERQFLDAARNAGEQTLRRLRASLAFVALLLAAAIVAGVATFISRSHAQHEATVALARQLGAEAVSEPRIDRAMLLARESFNLAPSQQTDGTLLATLLRSPAAIGTFTTPITDRPQLVRVSPDGRTIAVLMNTNLMRFYDTRTHRQIHTLPALNAAVPYMYLPGKDDLFVFQAAHASQYGNATGIHFSLIDTRTYRTLHTFPLDARTLNSPWAANSKSPVAATPDGRYEFLAYAVESKNGSDGAAYLDRWATARGGLPTTIPLRARGMLAIAATSDRRLVVATDGEVSTWDPVSLRRLSSRRIAALDDLSGPVAISPDGRVLDYGLSDGTVHFVDLVTGTVTAGAAAHASSVSAIGFSPDSRIAASGGDDGLVILWDPRTGQPLERLSGHDTGVHDLAFNGIGSTLYTSALDGTTLQWDLGGDRRFGRAFTIGAWPPAAHSPPPFAISPDGQTLAALASPTSVGLFSTASLRRTAVVVLPHGRQVTALAWAGHDLAVGDNAGGVGLYRIAGRPRLTARLHGLTRTVVALASSGRTLAAVDGIGPAGVPLGPTTGHLAIWNAGRLVRKPMPIKGILHGLAARLVFSRDRSLLAVAARNGPMLIVDARTGRPERAIQPTADDAVLTLGLSPQGTLAAGSYAGIVTLWNPRTGHELGHPILAGVALGAIAFDPTGHMFTTNGQKLWSTSTEQQLGADFPGGTTQGFAQWSNANFTPDGRYLFVVFADGSAYRWPATPAAWAAHACAVAGRNFTHEEWTRYIHGRAYSPICPS